MRRIISPALAAIASAIVMLSGGLWAAEPNQQDIETMHGDWTIESFTLDGNTIAPEQLKNWRRIVESNNHVTWKNGAETMVELDIKFDPVQKPMTLDSTIATGESRRDTMLAIYELQGDELRVCFASPGKPRPTEFSSTLGSGHSLYTAKRVKPSGDGDSTAKLLSVPAAMNSKAAAAHAQDEAVKKEKKHLIGVWKLVSCEGEGMKVPEEILNREVVRWTITESTIAWSVDKEGVGEGKYTLDPTTRPKAIDLTEKAHQQFGIYSLDSDTLKVCMDEGSGQRPNEFVSKPDTHLCVWIFKREQR